jgi:hypothetical protein
VASGTWNATTIAIAYGGTNSTATPTNGGIGYGTGTAHAYSTAGTSGQVLTSAGAAAPTWTTATNANTASAIVQRDASGNFSAGTITAALSGNASTATTATNVSGGSVSATTGAFSGNVTVSGTGSATLKTTGDITAYRSGGTTGVIFLNSAETRYLYFDGTNYQMPSSNLFVNGAQVLSGTVAIASGGTGGTTAATGLRNQYQGSWQRETSGGTMVPGNTYSIWTGGGAITMYLPTRANCVNGDKIYIQNLDLTWAGTNFTIARSDGVTYIMELLQDLVCNVNVGSIVMTCAWNDGSTAHWNVAPGG